MAPMRDWPGHLRQLVAAMARQADELRLEQTASSLTLLTLLALVPMVALGLLVFSALPAFEPLRADLERFLAGNLFVPSFAETVGQHINAFVASAERLSALGTAVFFGTALSAMLTIDQTLNGIWRTPRPRPLAQRLALYWALLTLGPVLLGAALALQVQVAARLPGDGRVFGWFAGVLPSLLGVGGFTLLFRLAPNEPVRWRHALAGGLLTALLLMALNRLLALYLAHFTSYTVIYGAFAALPLLLAWLFAVWMSVLLGALLAAHLRFWGLPFDPLLRPTPQVEFDRLVRVLGELVRCAPRALPVARLRAEFGGDAREADRVATLLAAQGYAVRVWPVSPRGGARGVWDECWLPTAELPGLTLRPLFERLWRGAPATLGANGTGTAPGFDPGGALLARPLAEVFATRA